MTATNSPARTDGQDFELVTRLEQLCVAVISDCLDEAGYRSNAMHPRIGPLYRGCKAAGFAHTVEVIPVEPRERSSAAYAGELQAVAALQAGDVMVTSRCDGAAYWGELLANASRARGARGVITDGFARDVDALEALGFPSFVAGVDPRDSHGRLDVVAHGDPVTCGDVIVEQGDLVLADRDGVVAIPIATAESVITAAENKVRREGEMRESLRSGMPIEEAFARHKVL